jgi:siroheme synthase-like protein
MGRLEKRTSVRNKLCVVVGSGKPAAAAAAKIVLAGGRVRVIGMRFSSQFACLDRVEMVRAAYQGRLLKDASLVVAASSAKLDAQVLRDARARRILSATAADVASGRILVQDKPSPRPASSGSRDAKTAVTARLEPSGRAAIRATLGEVYAHLARILSVVRPRAVKLLPNAPRRRAYFEALADDVFLAVIRRDGCEKALARAEKLLKSAAAREA